MIEKPITPTDVFVRKASKKRVEELRRDLHNSENPHAGTDKTTGAPFEMAEIRPDGGPTTSDSRPDVENKLREARDYAHDLLEEVAGQEDVFNHSIQPAQVAADQLRQTMEQIRTLVPSESRCAPETLPIWSVLSQVLSEVAEPYLRNLFLFKCAVLMARADGEISSVESDFLHSLAETVGIPAGETEKVIRNGGAIDVSDFHGSTRDAVKTIHQLYLCALADGTVQKSEKRMLHRIASTLGLPESRVHRLLYGDQDQKDIDMLDTAVLQHYLLGLSEMPKATFIAEDLDNPTLDDIRGKLGMPAEEHIFLVYTNRFLGQTLECAALTGQSLWAAPADEEPRALGVADIEDWYFGMRSSHVRLDDGREVTFSRDAQEFLKLVRECLRHALSSI